MKLKKLLESMINEIPMSDLRAIDRYADRKMGVNVVLTGKHFFDRLNDPRNKQEIRVDELEAFFDKLSKNKEKFIAFMKKYKQAVATDIKTNINIPFMVAADKLIGKTIMRNKDYRTSNKKYILSHNLMESKVLRVFDFDDTLATTVSYIYVNHKDGTISKLDPSEYAVYEPKPGDTFDYSDFNKMLNQPKVIEKNFKLLLKMLKNPQKKVTILTARKLAFPIRKYFKDQFGIEVDVVALGSSNPKDKSDWIEKHIKQGYDNIAFMDDSSKNVDAVASLQKKYPNAKIKSVLVK